MAINQVRLRRLHLALAPVMVLPLLLTLVTGSLYQFAAISGQVRNFQWLLALHRGQFGSLNLEVIYPFLNALGLLTMILTGMLMWWRRPRRSP